MNRFRRILLVSHAEPQELQALRHALELATRNAARFDILILYPSLPPEIQPYRDSLEQGLKLRLTEALTGQIGTGGGPDIRLFAASTGQPSMEVIRRVLAEGYDLVVKEADSGDTRETGLHAGDMELLRKCPCPVWLCRPFRHEPSRLKIGVAIDPVSEEPAAQGLSLRLLQLAGSLASLYSVPLHVISCWDFPLEHYLRHSTWVSLPDSELNQLVAQTRSRHEQALESLTQAAEIAAPLEIHRIRGPAATSIPQWVEAGSMDILIMGTVARTGIPGFVIGNTAEDILRKIGCSLLALKPEGFVSPVRL